MREFTTKNGTRITEETHPNFFALYDHINKDEAHKKAFRQLMNILPAKEKTATPTDQSRSYR